MILIHSFTKTSTVKKLFFLLAFSLFIFSASAQQNDFKVISPGEFRHKINEKKVQLIDVRTPEEFREGHIEGAININFFSDKFSSDFEKLNKNEPLYIYCRSGNRSAKAATKLLEMGFTNVIDLEGGYKAWTAQDNE